MYRLVFAALFLVVAGCARPEQGVALRQTVVPGACISQPAPNLALGHGPELVRAAGAFNYRSSWPSVDGGYWLDDISYFFDVQSDDQFHYDRLGVYYRTSQAVRSAVVVR
jgi:hypothetical protein